MFHRVSFINVTQYFYDVSVSNGELTRKFFMIIEHLRYDYRGNIFIYMIEETGIITSEKARNHIRNAASALSMDVTVLTAKLAQPFSPERKKAASGEQHVQLSLTTGVRNLVP